MNVVPIRVLALMALLAVLLPAGASAQFFGKNKVQYKTHDWRVLRTEHFDIHYYQGTEAAVHDAAMMAERAYRRLSRALDHNITARTPVVLYASNADFEQTNVVPDLIGSGTGGLTEFVKRRVLLPFTGSYADLDHVLTHELVHAFEIDILFGERQGLLANPFSSTPPLWLMEGTAEYLSIGRVDNNTKMWLRDAALEGYLIPIGTLSYVGDIRVYRFGQSIMEFIADSYGIQKIGEIFKRIRRFGNLDAALESATGLSVDVLSKKWTDSVRKAYLPDVADYDRPDAIADALTSTARDMSNFNVAPAVSPSGTQLVYISDRSMYSDIYLASALDGEVFKKVVAGERTRTVETLRYISTAMTWSPDEKQIAYPASAGGEDALYIHDVRSGKVVRKLLFGLDAIYSPTFSPDGTRIAFIGLKGGQSHLCTADVDGRNYRLLISGRHAVRDPAWSPDGGRIAFLSWRDDNWGIYVMAADGSSLEDEGIGPFASPTPGTPVESPASSGAPYDEAANPQKDIEAALASAQQDGKLVLLDFGANWCPDCVVLSTLFEDPSVQPYLQDHFYVVKIDVGEWDKNLDISQQYGDPIANGIPAVVVLAANGDIIATTKDGALANARTATAQGILGYLERWVAQKP